MTNYSRSQLANFSQSKMTNTPAPCFIFGRYDLSSAVSLIRVLPVVRATVLRVLTPVAFSLKKEYGRSVKAAIKSTQQGVILME